MPSVGCADSGAAHLINVVRIQQARRGRARIAASPAALSELTLGDGDLDIVRAIEDEPRTSDAQAHLQPIVQRAEFWPGRRSVPGIDA